MKFKVLVENPQAGVFLATVRDEVGIVAVDKGPTRNLSVKRAIDRAREFADIDDGEYEVDDLPASS